MSIGETFGLGGYFSNEYFLAIVVFVVSLIVLRVAFSLVMRILVKITSKTKTDADDIIIQKASVPMTLLALVLALRISMGEVLLTESVAMTFSKILYTAVVMIVAYMVYVFVDVLLLRGWKHISGKTKLKLDESLTNLMHSFLKVALVILAILYVLEFWGIEIGPLLGALGIAGLAVALALQPTLSNIFSGVAMILDKSIRVGDWIILEDGVWGIVEKIGIRSTKFRTFDNEMLVIPNLKFSDSRIQNVSMPEPKARVVIPFGVAYGSDVDKVKKTVADAVKKVSHYDKEEGVSVRFLEMGDSSLNFKVYFYIDSFEYRLSSVDEANTKIYNALNKAGLEIPFPQMDVHLKKK